MKIYVFDKPIIIEGFKEVITKYTNSSFVGGAALFSEINWETKYDAMIMGIDFIEQLDEFISQIKIVKEKTNPIIIASPYFDDIDGIYDLIKNAGATTIFFKSKTKEQFNEMLESFNLND